MSSGKKKLTDEEVREMIEDSDDEDFSDGSDEEFVPSGEELEDSEMEDVIEDIEYDRNYVCESQPNENDRNRASSSPSESTDEESDPVRGSPRQFPFEQQENLIWLSDVLALGRENFSGNPGVRNIEEILDEDRKVNIIKIFEYFLDDSLIEEMVTHTNNYAQTYQNVRSGLHSRMKRWKPVDKGDLKKLFGIIMFMGVKILPSIEHYWKLDMLYYCPLMHSIQMSYNRFVTILRCWHFADMQVDNSNITHKIDSLVQKLVGKFRSLYVPPQVIVVDESMIKFYGRLRIKMYKLLCVPLAKYLKDRKTDLCGTLRKNRVGLPLNVTKSKLKKGQCVARQKDNYITVLKWHDKRDVLMISTCHGDEMTSVRTRLGETLKPNAVIDYNDAKKGIDVADQLSSYHSPLHKSLTWFKKVAVDLLFRVAVVSARCIYNEYSTGAPLTMLEVQEQIIRHLLGPSANVTTLARPPSQGLSTHKLTEIPRRNNMLVRKRCTNCYTKLRKEGMPAASKAKQVHTECIQCQKAFCLDCFNNVHC
ncbi:unnamed protein product [Hermetia illucens]|uniref:PiggyBac transposable element-derived protein domain-containing protein n=1 Tax=Hermetia illucens TaxID=343691 RepID=A0A7R8YW88_HERIL|nr:unnamed protein product [Hermetia illucens]